jgi:cytochrome c556
MDEIRKYLSDVNAPSALRAQRADEEAAKVAERAAYAPFKTIDAPEPVAREVLAALEVVPEAITEVNKIFRGLVAVTPPASGIGPANVTFTRPITMDEAERVRRAISNAAGAEYRAGYGGAGEAFSEAEKSLRGLLDVASPELGAARATAAGVRAQRDSFKAGREALVGDVEERLMEFERITDPAKIEAYRAGLMSFIESKMTSPSRQSFMRNLTDETLKEGKMLRAVLPPDAVDEVLRKVETASEAQETANKVLFGRQSVTSDTTAEQARIGMGISAGDLLGVMNFSPEAMVNVASNIASRFTRDLTDAERARVARILVSEDPDLVRRAISDEGAMAALQKRVQELTAASARGAGRAGAVTGAGPGANLSQQTIRGLLAQ